MRHTEAAVAADAAHELILVALRQLLRGSGPCPASSAAAGRLPRQRAADMEVTAAPPPAAPAPATAAAAAGSFELC